MFHYNTKEYTFSSGPHITFFKIDDLVGHKANLNIYKNIKATACLLSDHCTLMLGINNKNNLKLTVSGKLSNCLLNEK